MSKLDWNFKLKDLFKNIFCFQSQQKKCITWSADQWVRPVWQELLVLDLPSAVLPSETCEQSQFWNIWFHQNQTKTGAFANLIIHAIAWTFIFQIHRFLYFSSEINISIICATFAPTWSCASSCSPTQASRASCTQDFVPVETPEKGRKDDLEGSWGLRKSLEKRWFGGGVFLKEFWGSCRRRESRWFRR